MHPQLIASFKMTFTKCEIIHLFVMIVSCSIDWSLIWCIMNSLLEFFGRFFCFSIILINGFCLLLSIKDAILHGSYIDFIVLGKNISCDVNKINWEPNNLIHIYINIVQTTSSTIDTLNKCIHVHNVKGHYNAIYVTFLVYLLSIISNLIHFHHQNFFASIFAHILRNTECWFD